ncbi:MAG: (2Fe-2S)-binding protein [Opitutales bacterium]|nr:(2Fe-2S)-binding protein [Opitutales bacterium]
MPKVTFITPTGERIEIPQACGTLMEAAVEHGVEGIDADCGGVGSCATCHVRVAREWLERVGPPGEAEQGTLDFQDGVDECSRLSCQIELTEALDGLVVEVEPL